MSILDINLTLPNLRPLNSTINLPGFTFTAQIENLPLPLPILEPFGFFEKVKLKEYEIQNFLQVLDERLTYLFNKI